MTLIWIRVQVMQTTTTKCNSSNSRKRLKYKTRSDKVQTVSTTKAMRSTHGTHGTHGTHVTHGAGSPSVMSVNEDTVFSKVVNSLSSGLSGNCGDSLSYDGVSYSNSSTKRGTPRGKTHPDNRRDVVSPFSSVHEEQHEYLEQRLDILRQQVANTTFKLDKLMVYISLEYLLNGPPDPMLLKDLYLQIHQSSKSKSDPMQHIEGSALCDYVQRHIHDIVEYVFINNDVHTLHCAQWKMTQIFSLYTHHHSMQHQVVNTKIQHQKREAHHVTMQQRLQQKVQQQQSELDAMKRELQSMQSRMANGADDDSVSATSISRRATK